MKKIYALLGSVLLSLGSLQAQTIDIVWASDSAYFMMNCAGADAYFNAGITTSGYSASDIATFYIDFGDGEDTLITDMNTWPGYPDNIWLYALHTYSSPGIYDVTYIFTMPDGNADTLINYNELEVFACDTLSGYVYCDANANCSFDGSDVYLENKLIYASAVSGGYGLYYGYGITDASGYYEIIVPSGLSYTLQIGSYSLPLSAYVCPASGTISTTSPSTNNDFAMNCSGSFDTYPFSMGGFLHPGFTESLHFGVGNLSLANAPDGQIRLVSTNPLLTFVNGIAAGGDNTETVSGDTLTWDLPGIYVNDFVYGYGYGVDLLTNFYTDPSATLGDTICFDLISEPTAGDVNPANNIQTVCFIVSNAWDPNYVEVSPCGQGPLGIIEANTDLVYTIHFQNTGNLAATNILVKDYLDPAVHDMSTFEYVASSHAVTEIIPSGTDGTIIFNLENINLPDSTSDEPNSHGWITFRIKQMVDLAPATSIENTAGIYFDFNPPVITNTALNTIKDPLGIEENKTGETQIRVFPVPSSGVLNLSTNSSETVAFKIIDLSGKIYGTGTVTQFTQIDLNSMDNGIYFILLETGETARFIINR